MYSRGFVFLVNAVCFLSCRNSKLKTSRGGVGEGGRFEGCVSNLRFQSQNPIIPQFHPSRNNV